MYRPGHLLDLHLRLFRKPRRGGLLLTTLILVTWTEAAVVEDDAFSGPTQTSNRLGSKGALCPCPWPWSTEGGGWMCEGCLPWVRPLHFFLLTLTSTCEIGSSWPTLWMAQRGKWTGPKSHSRTWVEASCWLTVTLTFSTSPPCGLKNGQSSVFRLVELRERLRTQRRKNHIFLLSASLAPKWPVGK